MVPGLVIRQVFVLLDLVLALLVVGVAALVVFRLLEVPPELPPLTADATASAEASANSFEKVAARGDYDSIVTSRLFGEAGQWAEPEDAPPPPPPEVIVDNLEETKLNLRLVGVIATHPTDPFGSALIENIDDSRSIGGYAPGQMVVDKVTLKEIYPRQVILLNERETPARTESLSMDEEEGEGAFNMASAVPSAPQYVPQLASSAERVNLDREELMQELYTNYADLVTKLRPQLYTDVNGNVAGVTAENISQIPLARKLGLSDGDVLQTVNNEMIDSEQKILEMVQKYQNASSFRIGILRDGKAKVITYRLN